MNTTTFHPTCGQSRNAGLPAAPDASSPTRAVVQGQQARPGAVFLSARYLVWWAIRRLVCYGGLIALVNWRVDGPLWLVASGILAIAVPATACELVCMWLAEDFRAETAGGPEADARR